jgi:hypothetical protein
MEQNEQPVQPVPDMNALPITLQLNVADINGILQALAELPFKVSADLIGKIRQQAIEQLPPVPQA